AELGDAAAAGTGRENGRSVLPGRPGLPAALVHDDLDQGGSARAERDVDGDRTVRADQSGVVDTGAAGESARRIVDAQLVRHDKGVIGDHQGAAIGTGVDDVGVFRRTTLGLAVDGEAGEVRHRTGDRQLALQGGAQELDADADVLVELDVAGGDAAA